MGDSDLIQNSLPISTSSSTSSISLTCFTNIHVSKAEIRAWSDTDINYAELSITETNIAFNMPKVKRSNNNRFNSVNMYHTSSINVAKVSLEYNFGTIQDNIAEFLTIIDGEMKGINLNHFYFKSPDHKNQLHFISDVGGIDIQVPYTELWMSSSIKLKEYIRNWVVSFQRKPNVKVSKKDNKPMSPDVDSEPTESNHQELVDAKWSIPVIHSQNSFHNITLYLNLFPNLHLRYRTNSIVVCASRMKSGKIAFQFNIKGNSLAFKTENEDFPNSDDLQWTIQSPKFKEINSQPHLNFNKQFVLPEIFFKGDTGTTSVGDQPVKRFLNISAGIDYMEQIVTSELLNYIFSVQQTVIEEVNSVIKVFSDKIEDLNAKNFDNITESIRTNFPKAQKSVKKLNLDVNLNILLEGFHITALGPATALVFDTGRIRLLVNKSSDLNIKLKLDKIGLDLVDTKNIKWSSRREFNDRYSSTEDCYKWASVHTSILVSHQQTNKNMFSVEVENSSIYLRPGFYQIGVMIITDYTNSLKTLVSQLSSNKVHIDTSETIKKLFKQTERYYSYYSNKIVNKVTKNPTMFIFTGSISVSNTTLAVPFGDNPYFGFLYNTNHNFRPTHICHVVMDDIQVSTKNTDSSKLSNLIVGLVNVNNLQAYIEELPENASLSEYCKPFSRSFKDYDNRLSLEKVTATMNLNISKQVIRGKLMGNSTGPLLHADPRLLSHIMFIKDDWLSSRHDMHLADDIIGYFRKQSESNGARGQISKLVAVDKQIHISGKFKMEPGQCELRHSLDIPDPSEEIIDNLFSAEHDNATISLTLPELSADFVHKNPMDLFSTQSRKRQNITHVQLSVKWNGVVMNPQGVIFATELWHYFNQYKRLVRQYHRRASSDTSTRKRYVLSVQNNSPIAKLPIQWMVYVTSAIEIQRIFRGYLTRKMIYQTMRDNKNPYPFSKEKQKLNGPISETRLANENRSSVNSVKMNTISFLCRIQPFRIKLVCNPVSYAVTALEFTRPFDFMLTRQQRFMNTNNLKAVDLYYSLYLSSPEIRVRMYRQHHHHSSSQPDFITLRLQGIVASGGISKANFLRPDRESVWCGAIQLNKIILDFNLPLIDQFIIFYTLWMEQHKKAKQAIKDCMEQPLETAPTTAKPATPSSTGRSFTSAEVRKLLFKGQTGTSMMISDHILAELDASSSRFAQVLVQLIEVNVDLGYTIGKQKALINTCSLFFNDRGRYLNQTRRDPLNLSAFMGSVNVSFSGRLSGSFSLHGIAFSASHHFIAPPMMMVPRCSYTLRVMPIHLTLRYNLDHIVELSTGELVFKFRNQDKHHHQTVISTDTIEARISSITGPIFIEMKDKLVETYTSSHESAMKMLNESQRFSMADPMSLDDDIESTSETYINLQLKSVEDYLRDTKIFGAVTVLGRNVNIYIHDRFDLTSSGVRQVKGITDGQFLHISLLSFQFHFKKRVHIKSSRIKRKLELFAAKVAVNRCFSTTKRKFILNIPSAAILMKTKQNIADNIVGYIFRSEFPSPIAVTTNLSEYQFFRILLGHYQKRVLDSLNGVYHSSEIGNGRYISKNDADYTNAETLKVPSTTTSSKSNPVDSIASTPDSALSFVNQEFVALEEMVLNPQLNVLGEMTPTIERVLNWLGVKDKTFIPRMTHQTISNPMEGLLIGCFRGNQVFQDIFKEELKYTTINPVQEEKSETSS
eukprot:CAMPEP_0117422976 /NCGR_PEP_ID=MMETSP0758-20121206/3723_1 /TAXON_ID=63605 /ORGANISM="Percolomonas cosmopolitus, Strain AE-1 (ATCC 50343)" /LENGTH=1696 /DNA_ID=CAMNT_0005205949 /DNA_START=1163 /DNA_END=6253 /DNA_ORIENTATION=-